MDYPKSTPGIGLVDGLFVDENPTNGQPGSLIPAAWANALMAELLGVIKGAGIVPDEGDNAQLLRAIQTMAASDYKKSVRVATTGAVALSGLQSVDGVALVSGERVLVKNQADPAQNWIYVAAAGVWQRAQDANENAECSPGHLITVQAGAQGAGTVWQLANTEQPAVGVDSLNFRLLFGKTGVASGSYRKLDVDLFGRVISGSNPDTLAGNGITDAYTKSQVDELLPAGLDGVRVDVQSAPTVDLTAISEKTPHLNIVGSVGITGFKVAAKKGYLVRFAGALTLTNSATLVTQTGANIITKPGDTCIVRAIGVNAVEILCYRSSVPMFSKEYVSTELAITKGAVYTLAHNFGVRPRLVTYTMRCITESAGYSVGDEIDVSGVFVYPGDNNVSGYTAKIQGLNELQVKVGGGQTLLTNAAAGVTSIVLINLAHWTLIVRAFA